MGTVGDAVGKGETGVEHDAQHPGGPVVREIGCQRRGKMGQRLEWWASGVK